MKNLIVFFAFSLLSNFAMASIWTKPILAFPSATKMKIADSCQAKLEGAVANQRAQLKYPALGSRVVGRYITGVSYFDEDTRLSAYKILIKGFVYKGSDYLFKTDIVVPKNGCEHYFEKWLGQMDSNCNILKLDVEIDDGGYTAC